MSAPTSDPGNQPTLDTGLSPTKGVSVRYEILNELGSGGMGVVYKARDRETGTIVALKLLHPEIAGRPELIERFKNELVLARKITHKNVCRVYDLNRFDRVVAISMEYVEGQSLRAVLDRPEGISVRYGLKIVHQVMSGLAEAHAQGVIHRDLKPENILIARDGTVKVMDFGIARSVDTGATLTGSITGTPAYMSPEQASGKTVDARSDIYSLGLVMYEMFCGQRAFSGDTPIAVAMKQVQETPPTPSEVNPHLPGFLNAVILKCIQKDPAKRFQSIAEIDTALTARADARPASAARTTAEPPMPVHLTAWQWSDWLLLTVAGLGVALFFSFFYRTSLAPRGQVSFDRTVLRRIAEEHAQKLGGPVTRESQIRFQHMVDRYDYVGEHFGAQRALELANNPVPYWTWSVDFENGTSVQLDHRGGLRGSARDFLGEAAAEPIQISEAQALAENTIRDVFNAELTAMRLETTAAESWRGHPATLFSWSDSRDYRGMRRGHLVRVVGRQIVNVASFNIIPSTYRRSDRMWQMFPWMVFVLLLLVLGLSQKNLVNVYSRWRIAVVGLGFVTCGWVFWLIVAQPLAPAIGLSTAILIDTILSLAAALLTFFFLIPIEHAIARMDRAKLSTLRWIFDRRIVSQACGIGILRGTLIGLTLLGVDGALVWLVTTYLGARLDAVAQIYFPGHLFLGDSWTSPLLVLYPVLEAWTVCYILPLFAFLGSRVSRSRALALLLAAALTALIFPGPVTSFGAVQPYYGKLLVLLADFIILSWTFLQFDVLTLFIASFTFAFLWQNYTMLVMLLPTGAFNERFAFALWALFVAAAAAVAFKPSLIAAYRRAAAIVQWKEDPNAS